MKHLVIMQFVILALLIQKGVSLVCQIQKDRYVQKQLDLCLQQITSEDNTLAVDISQMIYEFNIDKLIEAIKNNPQLQTIDLNFSYNFISDINKLQGAFVNSKNLQKLSIILVSDFSHEKFVLDNLFLGLESSLKEFYLDLSHNKVEYLDLTKSGIEKVQTLEIFSVTMYRSQIISLQNFIIFEKCLNLKQIYMNFRRNQLTELVLPLFSSLVNLESVQLDFSWNPISNCILLTNIFHNLPNLIDFELYMVGNAPLEAQDIQQLGLMLKDSLKLEKFVLDFIVELKNKQHLDLFWIRELLFPMKKITDMTLKLGALFNSDSLSILNGLFDDMIQLKKFTIAINTVYRPYVIHLFKIIPFHPTITYMSIDFGYNSIRTLEGIDHHLQQLGSLKLEYLSIGFNACFLNDIESFCKLLSQLSTVNKLQIQLEENRITDISQLVYSLNSIINLQHLEINLNQNRVTDYSPLGILLRNTNLKELDLQEQNKPSFIKISDFNEDNKCEIYGNQLRDGERYIFYEQTCAIENCLQDNLKTMCKSCQEKPGECSECLGYQQPPLCNSCMQGYVPIFDEKNPDTPICVSLECNSPLCAECTRDQVCTQCTLHSSLYFSKELGQYVCICIAGFYANIAKTQCLFCGHFCLQCINGDRCVKCQKGYKIDPDGSCIEDHIEPTDPDGETDGEHDGGGGGGKKPNDKKNKSEIIIILCVCSAILVGLAIGITIYIFKIKRRKQYKKVRAPSDSKYTAYQEML